jgi:hypothetical protein
MTDKYGNGGQITISALRLRSGQAFFIPLFIELKILLASAKVVGLHFQFATISGLLIM